MSGANTLPDSITITQNVVGPQVTITEGGCMALPPGVPVYPLSANPGQTWDLQDVNGVLTWVQFTAPPGQTALGLEDGLGAILLENHAGSILMEE